MAADAPSPASVGYGRNITPAFVIVLSKDIAKIPTANPHSKLWLAYSDDVMIALRTIQHLHSDIGLDRVAGQQFDPDSQQDQRMHDTTETALSFIAIPDDADAEIRPIGHGLQGWLIHSDGVMHTVRSVFNLGGETVYDGTSYKQRAPAQHKTRSENEMSISIQLIKDKFRPYCPPSGLRQSFMPPSPPESKSAVVSTASPAKPVQRPPSPPEKEVNANGKRPLSPDNRCPMHISLSAAKTGNKMSRNGNTKLTGTLNPRTPRNNAHLCNDFNSDNDDRELVFE